MNIICYYWEFKATLMYDTYNGQLHIHAKYKWNLSSDFQCTLWKNKKLKFNIIILYMAV